MGKDGIVCIKDGKFVVINPIESEEYATIMPPEKGTVFINNIPISNKTAVKEEDIIKFDPPDEKPKRSIALKISKDKMQAYITIHYEPKIEYYLKNTGEVNELNIHLVQKKVANNELFSVKEIEQLMQEDGIVFGIKKDVINEVALLEHVENVLIAEGREPIDAIDDSIEFLFDEKNEENIEDSLKAIDYRNINHIVSVNEGDAIANIIRGKDSILGKNIFGKEVRSKKNKIKAITAGHGCKIDRNKVVALQDGQVSFKKSIVTINKVYEVNGDVNISTGNINFQGDVQVNGNVTEGMLVCAKNNINISGAVYGCNVIALGDISINGNVINSNISAGGEDVNKELRLKSVKKLEEALKEIEKNIEYILDNNLLHKDITLGEVIKTLIDTKYKNLNRICTEVISNTVKDRDNNSIIIKLIHEKLIGLSVLNIHGIDDLSDVIRLINEEISFLEAERVTSASIELDYSQESRIQASGDVRVKGKGIFSTEMYSLGSIEFLNNTSVCRGGILRAKNGIKASIVGSQSGVKTLLEVEEKEGRIEIDVAYNNTEIKINNKKYIIEKPCKQVNCYIDSHGELIVDKFIL